MSVDLQPYNSHLKSFSLSWWMWRPLWKYCYDELGVLTKTDHEKGQYNDSHEINNEKCLEMADEIETRLMTGATRQYIKDRDKQISEMGTIPCLICHGDGMLKREGHSDKSCAACGGIGIKDHWMRNYPLTESTIKAFAEFLEDCEGFTIN